MYCLRCLYPLFGLRSRACPECGLQFDPRERRSVLRKPRRPMTQRLALAIHFGVFAMALLGFVFLLRDVTPSAVGGVNPVVVFFAALPVSLACAIGLTLREYRPLRAMGVARVCLSADLLAVGFWAAGAVTVLVVV